MSVEPCPHCGAFELVHHAWQTTCLACGKWSGEKPAEPEVVTHGTTAPPVVDGNEDRGIVSALITSLRRPVTRPGDDPNQNVEYPVVLATQKVPGPAQVEPPKAVKTLKVEGDRPTDPPPVKFPAGQPVDPSLDPAPFGPPSAPVDPPSEDVAQ